MANRTEMGREFEQQALIWFLEQKQAKLISRNFRTRYGELDLVFEEWIEDNQAWELVFLEVRSRSRPGWTDGVQILSLHKQSCLRHSIQVFLARYHGVAQSVRFDLLFWGGSTWEHLPNLWIF